MLQHEDCSPPVPDSMLVAPSSIMDTEAPTADQDPSTGYPSPATSGHSSAAHAAHHDSCMGACQNHLHGQDSLLFGDQGLSSSADFVPPSPAVFVSSPRSLNIALMLCQQYQQAWQQQQQQHPHDFSSVTGKDRLHDEGSTFGQLYSRSSPAPSQDPPTGYPVPGASLNDNDTCMSRHDWMLLKSHSGARLEQDLGSRSFGHRLVSSFDDAPQAIADLGAASRHLQHKSSCHNTPIPSQDPPSEHSKAGDDECSFAGQNGACSVGHRVTANPLPACSQEALPGIEDEDGNNGGYADNVFGDAPSSPVPSQDAPSEYPEPQTPASSAEESEAECSAESSNLTREPLPPGVAMSETHAAATLPGDSDAAMSHISSCHAVARQPLKATTSTLTGSPYNVQLSWWEFLQEQSSLDCVWDDYESGDESVGSPCRV